MTLNALKPLLAELQDLKIATYGKDFLLTWEKTDDEIRALTLITECFYEMHKARRPFRVFDTGLAVSIFRDKSTRTRFSFASAVNALGPGPFRTGRGEVADRPRRNRARDGEHDLVHDRGHRHPRRHVPGGGEHLHARGRAGRAGRLRQGGAAPAAQRHQPSVRRGPPHPGPGRPDADKDATSARWKSCGARRSP